MLIRILNLYNIFIFVAHLNLLAIVRTIFFRSLPLHSNCKAVWTERFDVHILAGVPSPDW